MASSAVRSYRYNVKLSKSSNAPFVMAMYSPASGVSDVTMVSTSYVLSFPDRIVVESEPRYSFSSPSLNEVTKAAVSLYLPKGSLLVGWKALPFSAPLACHSCQWFCPPAITPLAFSSVLILDCTPDVDNDNVQPSGALFVMVPLLKSAFTMYLLLTSVCALAMPTAANRDKSNDLILFIFRL